MGYKCVVCDINTIFFVWSSSAPFPRERLMTVKKYDSKEKVRSVVDGVPVCYCCRNMLDNVK